MLKTRDKRKDKIIKLKIATNKLFIAFIQNTHLLAVKTRQTGEHKSILLPVSVNAPDTKSRL
jgi:hypothetical protein